jgi:Reverse transcriptase (RNA-dependent DNA polymerase)/GAG-pre-integrase domain
MAEKTSTTTTQPTLKYPKDWDTWFLKARKLAETGESNIFEYVDPSTYPTTPMPRLPKVPDFKDINPTATTIGTLSAEEKETLRLELQVYKETHTRNSTLLRQIQKITQYILDTVDKDHLPSIEDAADPADMLRTLKKRLAPTDRAREIDFARQYASIQRYNKRESVESWLQRYEGVFRECCRLNLPEVSKERPLFDLLISIKNHLDTAYATSMEIRINNKISKKKELPTFYDLIEDFRNHHRINQASKATQGGSFATLGDKGQGKPSKCPVDGRRHWLSDCYYINEQVRPEGWKGKKETFDKLKKLQNDDPEFKKKVDKAKERTPDSQSEPSKEPPTPPSETSKLPVKATGMVAYSSFDGRTAPHHLKDCWILDSGSDIHVCNSRNRFNYVRPAGCEDTISSGKTTYQIDAFGTVDIIVETPTGPQIVQLAEVALVEGFLTNLVSISRFEAKGVHVNSQYLHLHQDGTPWCYYIRNGGHWILEDHSKSMAFPVKSRVSKEVVRTAKQWHHILGHPAYEAIANLANSASNISVDISEPCPSTCECEPCALSKAKRIISRDPSHEEPTDTPFGRISFDLIPMENGYNSTSYLSHIACCETNYTLLDHHFEKRDAVDILIWAIELINRRWRYEVKFVRIDGETAVGDRFEDYCRPKGITIERSAPHTQAQNGHGERSGSIIMIKGRALRLSANLPSNLWPEILKTAGYLMNRTPLRRLGWRTPFEAVNGRKPSLAHLKIFGCKAYPLKHLIPKLDRLEPRAHIGFLVGYDSTNIWRIWIPSSNRIIRSRDVIFDEKDVYNPVEVDINHLVKEVEGLVDLIDFNGPVDDEEKVVDIVEEDSIVVDHPLDYAIPPPTGSVTQTPSETGSSQSEHFTSAESPSTTHHKNPGQLPTPSPSHPPTTPDSPLSSIPGTTTTRDSSTEPTVANTAPRASEVSSEISTDFIQPTRTRQRHGAHFAAVQDVESNSGSHMAFNIIKNMPKVSTLSRDSLPEAPKTYKELKGHPHEPGFRAAMEKEYNKLQSKETFDYVDENPYNQNLLPLMWVFSYKFDTNGFFKDYKARLVARGDKWVTEEDTYSATLAAQTFRAIMALVAAFDLKTLQFDAINAYVNALLPTPIACYHPVGVGPQNRRKCAVIRRALYGLPISGLLWYQDISGTLESFGIFAVPGVNCLFTNGRIIVVFYVDDIIAVTHDQQALDDFQFKLQKAYEVRTMGEVGIFLGIRVIRDKEQHHLYLVQDGYADKVASRFHLIPSKSINSPLTATELRVSEEQASKEQIYAYQQRVGSLSYPSLYTRPDLSFACTKLSEFQQNPSKAHMAAVDRALTYWISTKWLGIKYSATLDDERKRIFTTWTDASHGDDPITRYSSAGFIFFLFGGPLYWRAYKQKTVTTSSTEAELLGASTTGQNLIWWNGFFKNIHFDLEDEEPTIFIDNMQTIRLLKTSTPRLTTKLRHVDIHQAWLRQEVQRKRIEVEWVATVDMVADGLTKPLSGQRFQNFVKQLNLVDCRSLISD